MNDDTTNNQMVEAHADFQPEQTPEEQAAEAAAVTERVKLALNAEKVNSLDHPRKDVF